MKVSASAGNVPNRWCDSSTPRSPGMHWHALAAWRRPSHPAWRCNKAPAIERARIAVLGTRARNGPRSPPDHSSPPHHWPGPNPTNHPSALDSAGTGRTLPVRQCKTVCSVPPTSVIPHGKHPQSLPMISKSSQSEPLRPTPRGKRSCAWRERPMVDLTGISA